MNNRERILQTAMDLFIRYGIRAITMDRIAVELGISKRTIYELFRDKNDLLEQAIRSFVLEQKRISREILKETPDVIEVIFRFADRQQEMMRETNPQFIHDLRKYHSGVYRTIMTRSDIRDYSLTRTLLTNGMEQGIIRKDIHLELVNRFMHVLTRLYGPEADQEVREFSHREIFEHIFLSFIRGICTEKGIRRINEQLKSAEKKS